MNYYDDNGRPITTFQGLYHHKQMLQARADQAAQDARTQEGIASDLRLRAAAADRLVESNRFVQEDAQKEVGDITQILDNWTVEG